MAQATHAAQEIELTSLRGSPVLSVATIGNEYPALRALVKKAGLFKTQYLFYVLQYI
jgi:hypothetical protein